MRRRQPTGLHSNQRPERRAADEGELAAFADVAAEVAGLRARGVDVADYDEPGLRTVDGVADIGFALSAWFVDPGGNTIGLLQFKDEALR